MLNADPDFDLLSAYVDGELSVAAAAALATRLAAEPALAARLAKVAGLKQAVASLTADSVVLVTPVRAHRPRPLVAALAACVALFVLLAGLYFVSDREIASRHADTLVADALAAYDDWRVSPDAPARIEPSAAPFLLPSLDGAGLFLVGTAQDVPIGGKSATQAVFQGPHGCRLSLFSWREAGGDDALKLDLDQNADTARWRTAGTAYLLVSRHMDEQRFLVIARAANGILARRLTASADTDAVLETAHQPCMAKG